MIAQRLPLIEIHRIALHTIYAKRPDQKCSEPDHDEALLSLTDEIKGMLKTRIIDAAGKHSKAFTLEIAQSQEGTFYDSCLPIKDQTDDDFLATSCQLATLLAVKQTRNRIPGGYFLLLNCSDKTENLGQYIVIKAEPDQGVTHSRKDKKSNVTLLDKILFSSAQKLFKIGMLFQRRQPEGQGITPNELYECLLFDNQFSNDKKPAEYFYKDFLAFSIDKNAKIQTQRFDKLTEDFITQKVTNQDDRESLINALRVELKSQDTIIQPAVFAQRHLESDDLKDLFTVEVTNQLPSSIEKDLTLLSRKVQKRKIDFSSDVMLTAPDEDFEEKVHIMRPDEDIDLTNTQYTYVRVKGQPFKRNSDE